jgi:hypothetical protein
VGNKKMNKEKKQVVTPDNLKEIAVMTIAVGIIAAAVYFFLIPSQTSISCAGDHYCALCTVTCINGYDDTECGLTADRIYNLWERIWGEDGIYKYFAATVSGSI